MGDNLAFLRNRLHALAVNLDEWSGIPIPLAGERLIIEPKYKYVGLGEIGKNDGPPADYRVRNVFYSHRRRCEVAIFQEADGRVTHGMMPAVHHMDYDLRTLGCSSAWGMEQEAIAMDLLASMIRPHAFKQYLLTGMFLETSARSGIRYVFRRLRPTIALRDHGEQMRILCALCMHPIAFYEGSWAGAMCPTDDVVAHLSMMRADEPMYWRRSNQHAPHRPEAGL